MVKSVTKSSSSSTEKHPPSLNALMDTIDQSRGGPAIKEAIDLLHKLVTSEKRIRDTLLNSKENLLKLTRSYLARKSRNFAESTKKRFEEADSCLLTTLSEWDNLYGDSYPTFSAWLEVQRRRGLNVNVKSRMIAIDEEAMTMKLTTQLSEFNSLKKEFILIQTELKELLETFTPDLDRAFAELDETDQSGSSAAPIEIEGENDALFSEARHRFDFLTKKLIPRLNNLIDDIKVNPRAEQTVNEGIRLIASVHNSPTYLNFLLLLSRSKRKKTAAPNPVNKKKRSTDQSEHEYDDWFQIE